MADITNRNKILAMRKRKKPTVNGGAIETMILADTHEPPHNIAQNTSKMWYFVLGAIVFTH
jgi:hypothetical protein